MSLFTEYQLREAADKYKTEYSKLYKSASTILLEDSYYIPFKTYDIFLSHSSLDAAIILGLKYRIEKMGFSTYIDWIEDNDLDRTKVNKETAERLRKRMQNCKCLFFATSKNSSSSKWMPWECGYFDGYKSKVAILPVAASIYEDSSYSGQEYLSLYPYIEKATPKNSDEETLWIREPDGRYIIFSAWLDGQKPYFHR